MTLNLKKFLPKTLFQRFLLIILLPTIIAQGIAVYIFYERHWASTQRNIVANLGEEMAAVTHIAEGKSDHNQDEALKVATDLGFNAAIRKDRKLPEAPPNYSGERLLLAKELQHRLAHPFTISKMEDPSEEAFYIIRIDLGDRLLRLKFSNKRLTNSSTYIFIMWMVGSAMLLMVVSILFLKNQVNFISRMAQAADEIGKGHEIENFKPRGALEVRQAALAFIKMQERIKRQIEQRIAMLAGISHDLRTPLTRMKLQLALLGTSEEIGNLGGDIDEMEKMIEGYINFSKGQESEESKEIRLSELLGSVADNYRRQGKSIEFKPTKKDERPVKLRENAIKRMLGNIIDNAFRHGKNVHVSNDAVGNSAIIFIDDDGPGIPEDMREEVFKPFFRLDFSRNADTGGSGLGLAITLDIVRAHGGDIKLDVSPLGGLRVMVRLPIT